MDTNSQYKFESVVQKSYTSPQWIVNERGEVGVLVGGLCYFFYAAASIKYPEGATRVRPVESAEHSGTMKFPSVAGLTIAELKEVAFTTNYEWFEQPATEGELLCTNLISERSPEIKDADTHDQVLVVDKGDTYTTSWEDVMEGEGWCPLPFKSESAKKQRVVAQKLHELRQTLELEEEHDYTSEVDAALKTLEKAIRKARSS